MIPREDCKEGVRVRSTQSGRKARILRVMTSDDGTPVHLRVLWDDWPHHITWVHYDLLEKED